MLELLTEPKQSGESHEMDKRAAGRRGGRQRSVAKQAAARANGARGGRPKKAAALVRCMIELRAKVAHLKMDPGDRDLIVERLCRQPGSGRRFFIRPRKGGGYGF